METGSKMTIAQGDRLEILASMIAQMDDKEIDNLEKYAATVLAAHLGESDVK